MKMIDKLKALFGREEELKTLLSKNDISFDLRVHMWANKNLSHDCRTGENVDFWIQNKKEAQDWLALILKDANKEEGNQFDSNQICEMLSLLYWKKEWLDQNKDLASWKELAQLWSKSEQGMAPQAIIKGVFDLEILTTTLDLITRYMRTSFGDLITEGKLCKGFEGTIGEQRALYEQIFSEKLTGTRNEHLLLCLFKNKTIDLDVLCSEKWEISKNSWDSSLARAVRHGVITSELIEKTAPLTGPLWFLSYHLDEEVMEKVPTHIYKEYYQQYKDVPMLENKIEREALQKQFLASAKKTSPRAL